MTPNPVRPFSWTAVPALVLALTIPLLAASPASAVTQLDASGRIVIDGLTDEIAEWELDEDLFQLNDTDPELPALEEGLSDSQWGSNNDLNQIRITWDARFLYVAVNAVIWNNNTIVLFDYRPGGMTDMTNLNSWRRNFTFRDIEPDAFLATWDGNTIPQVWTADPPGMLGTNQVVRVPEDSLQTVATFAEGSRGRAMEAAIPWQFLLGEDAERVFSPDYNDSVFVLPSSIEEIRVVGVITAGGDGTGGPDSAPDNLSGHQNDSAIQVTIDNFVRIPLDLDGPAGEPDGVVDFGADIRARSTFHVRPPIRPLQQEISGVVFDKPIISPEQGGKLRFRFELQPPFPPDEDFRRAFVTAEVRNLRGELVKTLYQDHERDLFSLEDDRLDVWDCRDQNGAIVDGGIYLLRIVLEDDISRVVKAFSVVR